ncbi:MAG TPA: hypothetical protein V6C58_14355, partial [Allocoleopsis sp.]
LESYCSCFAAGTLILTENGLMKIEDVYNSSIPVKLISYNQEKQTFEAKSITEKSVRNTIANKYSVSQTRRRLENTITCTPDHPFATYENGGLTYQSIEEILTKKSGVIVPTQMNLPSNLTIEDQDHNFYYLLGVILSDGTIHHKQRTNAPEPEKRSRQGKYDQHYVRFFQSVHPDKKSFVDYVETLLRNYTNYVSVRVSPPRKVNIKGREIQGNGLVEITASDADFVNKIESILPNLGNILLTNPFLALHFLAGYLDGDGSFHQNLISISLGKIDMFSPVICALLCLGVAYLVYRNRNNYIIEFRDNIVMSKLREICHRLKINEPPQRLYSDKLVLASAMTGGVVKCDDLTTMAKQGKMVNVSKLEGGNLDQSLAMNRVFYIETMGEVPVY